MVPSSADVRFSQFRRLVDHAGWWVLPAAPYDDRQGPDIRERIGKDGVVFSAYPIPRGPGHYGKVELDPPPQWAQSTGLTCDVSVEDLCENLGFAGDPERSFEFLGSRLEDVKAFMESSDFARTKVGHAIEVLNKQAAVHKSMLYDLRPQLGLVGLMKALLAAYVSHRGQLARYRRALRSRREGRP